MFSTDRTDCDAQVDVLCAGFNVPSTAERKEAYWRGLAKMPLPTFARLVDQALGEEGGEKIPTSSQLWALYRKLRASQPGRAPAPKTPDLIGDDFDRLGQCWLLGFLLRPEVHPITGMPWQKLAAGVSPQLLRKLINAKNDVVALYRSSGVECGTDAGEWLDIAFAEFARIAASAPAQADEEIAA